MLEWAGFPAEIRTGVLVNNMLGRVIMLLEILFYISLTPVVKRHKLRFTPLDVFLMLDAFFLKYSSCFLFCSFSRYQTLVDQSQ